MRLSLVIPNPGPVVEDVRQTDPEPVDRSIVAHQSLSFQLADESFLFFPRANLDQMSTTLFTFPSRVVPRRLEAMEQIAARGLTRDVKRCPRGLTLSNRRCRCFCNLWQRKAS